MSANVTKSVSVAVRRCSMQAAREGVLVAQEVDEGMCNICCRMSLSHKTRTWMKWRDYPGRQKQASGTTTNATWHSRYKINMGEIPDPWPPANLTHTYTYRVGAHIHRLRWANACSEWSGRREQTCSAYYRCFALNRVEILAWHQAWVWMLSTAIPPYLCKGFLRQIFGRRRT